MARDFRPRANAPTRADDERLLRMLAARDAGASCAVVAERFGTTRAAVAGLFKRVRDEYEASARAEAAE